MKSSPFPLLSCSSFQKTREKILTFFLLFVILLLGSLTGCSQQPSPTTQVVKIAFLTMGEARTAKIDGLERGLTELGLGGKNVQYTIYNAHADGSKLGTLAEQSIRGKPDILIATGFVEAHALVDHMKGAPLIPVVMIGVTSPSGLLQSFQDLKVPVTGVDNGHVELTGKRIELLHLIFPTRPKTLVLYDPRLQASLLALAKAEKTAQEYSYQIEPVPVGTEQDLKSLRKRTFTGNEALLVLPSYFLEDKYLEIRDLSLAKKIPVMGLYSSEAQAGYTASYGVSYTDQGYQAARLVVRMLKEKHNIPMEMPDSVQLVVNMKASQIIGVQVSPIGLSYGKALYTLTAGK